jgi:hypothetical protein
MTCDAAAAERGDYQGNFRTGAAHNLFLGDRLDGLPKITNRLEGTADKKILSPSCRDTSVARSAIFHGRNIHIWASPYHPNRATKPDSRL